MKVTEKISFNDYWRDTRFSIKKPARNGSHVAYEDITNIGVC